MKNLAISFFVLGFFLQVMGQESTFSPIENLLEEELRKENIYNVYLSVFSPSKGIDWHFAKGAFSDGQEVTAAHPFYTASVGKTFTATAIGLLVDRGALQFDDPLNNYLSADLMKGLHVYEGVDYDDSLTIAQLLQHTSGLPDYFDDPIDGTAGIFDLIVSEPDRFWEPKELIEFSKEHFEPQFAPGKGYAYTDTEYVLLGLVIEAVSGKSLHQFLEDEIFQPLKLNHTYLNLRSEPLASTPRMAEMYAGPMEISSLRSISADWAGGAIVSTGKDLNRFLQALLTEQLVSQTTLKAMQEWVPETKGMRYGFGLRSIQLQELSQGLPEWELIGHSGLNGTSMYYCPELDIYVSGTLNQLEASRDAVGLMVRVLLLCQQL